MKKKIIHSSLRKDEIKNCQKLLLKNDYLSSFEKNAIQTYLKSLLNDEKK